MSDTILLSVLRMPPDLWGKGNIDVAQRNGYYKSAADRIEKDTVRIRELDRRIRELEEILHAFLRAPSVGSDGPGSSTIVVQEYHIKAARTALKASRHVEKCLADQRPSRPAAPLP